MSQEIIELQESQMTVHDYNSFETVEILGLDIDEGQTVIKQIVEAQKFYKEWKPNVDKVEMPHLISCEYLCALQSSQRTKQDEKNGQIVHLLDGYIKDLELLDRLLPTSGVSNKEILSPAVKDVLKRLYEIREAKP